MKFDPTTHPQPEYHKRHWIFQGSPDFEPLVSLSLNMVSLSTCSNLRPRNPFSYRLRVPRWKAEVKVFHVPWYPLPSLSGSHMGPPSCRSSISLALSLGAISLGLTSHYPRTQLATMPTAGSLATMPMVGSPASSLGWNPAYAHLLLWDPEQHSCFP